MYIICFLKKFEKRGKRKLWSILTHVMIDMSRWKFLILCDRAGWRSSVVTRSISTDDESNRLHWARRSAGRATTAQNRFDAFVRPLKRGKGTELNLDV